MKLSVFHFRSTPCGRHMPHTCMRAFQAALTEYLPYSSNCVVSPLSTMPHHLQDLPTFVLDQHALQRSSSRDLAQPQFPVHLPLRSSQQSVPVSNETQGASQSAVLIPRNSCKASLCLFRLSRRRLKSASIHCAGEARASSLNHLLHCGAQTLYERQPWRDADPPDKVFTHAVLESNHLDLWS